ncbi:MAG: phosphatidate cytidylyltransferase [Magnetococcales bacterium]|nr:phosphatidate cytidylyltransferase [Magnetococcales bacterium]
MARRILSAVVLIPPLLLLLLYGSPEWLFVLLLPVSAILLHEWHAMSEYSSASDLFLAIVAACFLLAGRFPGWAVPLELLLVLFLMVLLVFSMPRYQGGGGDDVAHRVSGDGGGVLRGAADLAA